MTERAIPGQDRHVPLWPANFVSLGVLGRGSSSVVHRAKSTTFDDVVALKVWQRSLTEDERIRFRQECSLHHRLSGHPNIVRLLWADAPADGSAWIATELCDESLDDRLHRSPPLSGEDAFELAEDVLSGLAEIHRQGHIHRDIKPGNILLRQGRAVLCDMGIAKPVDRHTLNAPAGSPGYLAPELGRGRQPGPRSDVYSAAVTLYGIFGENPPDGVERLLTRATSSEPADRPPDAGVFLDRLQAARAKYAAPSAEDTAPRPGEHGDRGAKPTEVDPSTTEPLTRPWEHRSGDSSPPRSVRRALMMLAVIAAAAGSMAFLESRLDNQNASAGVGTKSPTIRASSPANSSSPVPSTTRTATTPASSATATVTSQLQSLYASKCMTVHGPPFDNGTGFQLWDCINVPDERWVLTGDGHIKGLAGKCLEVRRGPRTEEAGTPVQLWSCADTPAQQWSLTSDSKLVGYQGLCLDVRGPEPANGTPIEMRTCSGVPQQAWRFF
ncbi:protein kinase [Streptomyces sp. NBC_00885]|uniref:serine/threonine protein kinase n=1 Tax=Streptomyces sp. NBC_00885 TaxID=2975857 RepID=UPI00386E8FDB|nr:protein kinase [Streptomyces sp. NBC_00885]